MHVPKGQDLLVRGPFLQDFKSPKAKSPPYTVPESEFTDMKGLLDKSQPMKIAFYTRHNPHPVRVRHMKGLLDVPICCVEDNMDQRILWSPPSGQDLSSVYFPRGNSRYGANSLKQFPAIGIGEYICTYVHVSALLHPCVHTYMRICICIRMWISI